MAEPTAPPAQKGTIYRSRWADLARRSGTLYVADAEHRVYVVDPDQMPIAGMPLAVWPPVHTPAQPPPDMGSAPEQPESAPAGPPSKAGVRSAVFWSYALTAGRVGTTTIVTFVLAKLLGPSEFGVVAMALLFLTIAQTLLQQGLVSAIIQREDLTDEHLDAAFVILLLSGLGMGVVMAAGSPLWALAFGEPQLTAVCLAFAPLLLVQALAVVPEAVLRRTMGFRAIAVRTLVATVSGGVVGIVLAVLGAGVWALVWQQVVTAVVGALVLWAVSPWRPRLRGRLRAIRDLWGFSAHSANAALALQLGGKADQFVIGLFFGPIAIGIYRLAARLPEMFVDVTVRSLQQVALPALSRLQDDRPAFAARLASLQHLGAVAGLPMLGVLAACAEALVAFLGPQWDGTALPLQLLCLYGAVNVYGVLLGPALQAIGSPGRLAAIAWARGVVGVVVFLAVGLLAADGDPGGQAAAVALSAVAVQVVLNTVAIQVTRRTIATKLRLLTPTLPAVAAAVAAVTVPFAIDRLGVADITPILRLLLNGTLGVGAAVAVLAVTDRRLRTMVRGRLRPPTRM